MNERETRTLNNNKKSIHSYKSVWHTDDIHLLSWTSLFKLMNAEEAGWLMRKIVVQGSNPNDSLTIFRWVWTLFDGENL